MLLHLRQFFTHRRSISVGLGFFILGFLFGNWATLIPYIKTKFVLDDADLGLILLCLPAGAMTFNPIAANLISKFGSSRTTIFGMIFLCLAYMLPVSVGTVFLLPISLIFVGISITILNISANNMATLLEKHENVRIMSTCHGMFSVGLMSGSVMRSFTLLVGLSETHHMLVMCVLALILSLTISSIIIKIPYQVAYRHGEKIKLIIPKGALLTIIIISLCINVTEGCMADWASVYMTDIVRANPYFVGWGLFGYSFMMAFGRFFGDGIIPVFGRNQVLMYGAILVVTGITLAIALPYTWAAITGFGIVGLGVSCGAPILYAAASRYPDLPAAGGLAIMNTYAMAGFLLGPVVIGFISNLTNLAIAFSLVILLGILWFFQAKKVELP